jgi:beta-mannanase
MWDANLPPGSLKRTACYDPATDESNGNFSPAQYVAAWQHIRSIFDQQGVTNVIWVWSVSSAGTDPGPFYPGDSQVDWIGIDAYDTAGTDFAGTFSPIYSKIATYGKPVLVTETGASPFVQAQFLQGAVPALQTQFPLVHAFIYYDANSGIYQWALSSDGVAAFTALGHNPYFSAMPKL